MGMKARDTSTARGLIREAMKAIREALASGAKLQDGVYVCTDGRRLDYWNEGGQVPFALCCAVGAISLSYKKGGIVDGYRPGWEAFALSRSKLGCTSVDLEAIEDGFESGGEWSSSFDWPPRLKRLRHFGFWLFNNKNALNDGERLSYPFPSLRDL